VRLEEPFRVQSRREGGREAVSTLQHTATAGPRSGIPGVGRAQLETVHAYGWQPEKVRKQAFSPAAEPESGSASGGSTTLPVVVTRDEDHNTMADIIPIGRVPTLSPPETRDTQADELDTTGQLEEKLSVEK
jgi:hypothetical protein